ncbi:hypothetical protein BRD19_00020 [Halobacteriales archaeon SW_7_65_23]|nr:MAG: hypothetical protein BRD19_00020 [Halobacteriales archaeon SW_7_65_23]
MSESLDQTEDEDQNGETPSSQTAGGDQTDDSTDATTNGVATSNFKVKGEISDETAAGVLGDNTSSGETPVGVEGNAPNSSNGRGVVGTSLSNQSNYTDFAASPEGYGVYGVSDRYYGVFAYKPAGTDGPALFARSDVNVPSILTLQTGGGPAIETQDVEANGYVEADGYVEASDGFRGNVGASAYKSSSQTVSGNSTETVVFGSVEADQRNEYDESNGEFTCAYDGTYNVDVGLNLTSVDQGDEYEIDIEVNGGTEARKVLLMSSADDGDDPTFTLSRNLFNLSSGDTIKVDFKNEGSNSVNVYGSSSYWTWLTVRQVG